MGQLRSAVRAFAKLDLPPAEVLEYLDSLVQDLEGDQIVTCVYAVFDSTDQTLSFASAGHLPPLLLPAPLLEVEATWSHLAFPRTAAHASTGTLTKPLPVTVFC